MPDLYGQKAFVTGAGGFIGANLCRELLKRGAAVHAMLRPGGNSIRLDGILKHLQVHHVDITNGEELSLTLQAVEPDYIFNLVSPAGHPKTPAQKMELLKVNVFGTENLLEAILPLDFKCLVHFGSSTEYGSNQTALTESQRLTPSTFRGAAKGAAGLLLQQFAMEHHRPIVIIRPFSVYGYWEAPTRFIPTTILAALQGKELRLTQPGFKRDLIFVEDLVEASLMVLDNAISPGEIFNIGSGIQYLNEEIVDVIQCVSGEKIHILAGAHPASPSDTHHWIADVRKAKEILGWQPRHSLEMGMQKNIDWFRENQHLYNSWKNYLVQG